MFDIANIHECSRIFTDFYLFQLNSSNLIFVEPYFRRTHIISILYDIKKIKMTFVLIAIYSSLARHSCF